MVSEEKKKIIGLLNELTDYGRLDVFANYCKECGTKNTPCNCWKED